MIDRITLLEIVYLSLWGLLGVGIGFFLKSWLSVKTSDGISWQRETARAGKPAINTRSWSNRDETQPQPIVALVSELASRERQQAALTQLGHQGMTAQSLAAFFKEASAIVANTLDSPYSDLLERLPDGERFCWRSGVGWQSEEVETPSVMLVTDTLSTLNPVAVTDWQQETRIVAAPWWKAHQIRSSLIILVSIDEGPYGILSVHDTKQRSFSDSEIRFLQTASYLVGLTLTRYRQAEKSQQLERAINASNNGITIADARQPCHPSIYVNANAAFEQMTGYSDAEMLGRNFSFLQGNDNEQLPTDISDRKRAEEERDRAQLLDNETGKLTLLDGITSDITERKQAEDTLREREEFFRLIFDLAPTGMAIANLEGKLMQVNPALCEMVGYTEAELLKRRCADITHPDDRSSEFHLSQQLLRGEISYFRVEKRYISKKGDIINAILQVSLIRDLQGQPLSLFDQTVDISDRQQAETALRESEERLSCLIFNITDGLIVVDEEGHVCFVNPAAEALFGRSQSELLVHPFGLPFVSHEITEIGIRHASGTLITTEMRVADINWEGKTAYLISLRDVTESYHAKQALAESEAKYRQIVETATEGIWVIDRNNQTTFVNQQMAKMLGYSVEEMLGQNLMAFMDESGKMMANHYVERRRQGIAETYDFQFRRRDGTTLWAMLSTHPLFDSEGDYIGSLAMIADITERKRVEQALYESEQRLESILNSIQDVVWSASATTLETLFLNPATEKIYGYPISHFFEQKRLRFELVHADDKEQVERHFQELLATGSTEMEYRFVRSDGQVRWMYARVHVVYDAQGTPLRLDGIDSDITERKEAETQLQHNATHDGLTQLPNRLLFRDRLEHALAQRSRYHHRQFAVLILDLDEFKVINDSLGHMSGDELLLELARRLQTCLRSVDTLARLGGDEFAILLEEVGEIKDAIKIAERIHKSLRSPFSLSNQEVFINASIGIALSTADYKQPIEILRDADTAMYRAKATGKACYAIFDQQMHASAVTRLQLETDLRRAVERQEFQLYYQPIVSLKTGELTGFEALIRWQHPQKGLVSPAQFIPVAEETGLIVPMGEWIFLETCQQLKTWQQRYSNHLPSQLSVNLSSKQLRDVHLIDKIDSILRQTGLDSCKLKVEITESLLMENVKLATEVLLKLRDRHIEICLDDFGTGYSSLSYLHRFPVNTLKIDRSFVMRMEPNDENAEIVRAIVTLAHILGMTVIAEGVETQLQLTQLRCLGCEQGQGYFFAKPLTHQDATLLLDKSHTWDLGENKV